MSTGSYCVCHSSSQRSAQHLINVVFTTLFPILRIEPLVQWSLPLEDATQIVQKIIAYDRAKPSNSILLVADRNEGFDFAQLNQQLHDLLSATLQAKEINRSNTGDEQTRRELLAALNGGAKLVNYVGHGSVSNWNGNLLTVTDANTLSNRKQLSLFVMMNCLNGYFHEATRDSLAEALLKAEGGAIAVWASSGLTMPQQQAAMNQALYRVLFDEKTRAVTLGEAVAKAKASTNNQDIRRSWVLLGDPTTRLR